MSTPDELRLLMQQVTNIDEHAASLEAVVLALEDLADPTLVEDVLGVFERCDGQDDYGMFSSLQSWIDGLPRSAELTAALEASLARRPTWKVIEMIGGYAESPAQAADLLEQVQAAGTFVDPRYDAAWLQKRIDELRAS